MAKYQYTVKGVDYEVEIQDIEGNIANVTVNGIPFEVEMKQPVKAGKQKVKLGGVGSEERRVKSEEFNSAANHEVQSSNLKVQCIRLALYPKTGRTHQLRVHCAHREGLDAPILGDPLYGNVKTDRLYLHAEAITFKHPLTGKEIHIERKADF